MVYAQVNLADPTQNPLAKFGTIGTFLNLLSPLITIGAAVIFLGMLMYGAIVWITAGNETKNVAKAQLIMTYAVVGLLIVVLARLAMSLISTITGIKFIL